MILKYSQLILLFLLALNDVSRNFKVLSRLCKLKLTMWRWTRSLVKPLIGVRFYNKILSVLIIHYLSTRIFIHDQELYVKIYYKSGDYCRFLIRSEELIYEENCRKHISQILISCFYILNRCKLIQTKMKIPLCWHHIQAI